MFKVNIKDTRRRCSGVCIANFEHVSHLVPVFLFLTFRRKMPAGYEWKSRSTHFWLMFPFYLPWKHQKNFGFLVFAGGIKWEHRLETGYVQSNWPLMHLVKLVPRFRCLVYSFLNTPVNLWNGNIGKKWVKSYSANGYYN